MLTTFLVLYFKSALACRSQEEILNITNHSNSYFSNSSTWNGWNPPEGDGSWLTWITLWGTENSSIFDSAEDDRGPETGWPRYWKGLGKGNSGVPPPPWAYVPFGYGKPQYCFLQPRKGNCADNLIRWGFNPTRNKCQTFQYSGCGGNQNNFRDKKSCIAACVDVPSTDCQTQLKINFEEMIYE